MKQYSIKQASNLLKIKVRTTREWLRSGKLKGTKDSVSGRWSISEDEIKRLKEGGLKNDNQN